MAHPKRDVQRRDDTDMPTRGVEDVLGLLDEADELESTMSELSRRVAALLGLQVGELRALQAVAAGAEHPRAVAQRTGQVNASASATVESLVQRGLVDRHRHPAAPAGASEQTLVHLTERGRVTARQAEGIRIRVVEAIATALGRRRTGELRGSMQALASVFGDARPTSHELPQ